MFTRPLNRAPSSANWTSVGSRDDQLQEDTFSRRIPYLLAVSLDEKIRYGIMAAAGVSLIFGTLGLHLSPPDVMSGIGS
jgi:hypothetical protein